MTRDPSLHILQHALGLDDYGLGSMYRNHFVTGPDCDNWALCQAHAEAGRMERHGPQDLFGGSNNYCFTVTDAGRAFVLKNSPKPPKMTRDQKRYQQYINARAINHDLSFSQFLKNGCRP